MAGWEILSQTVPFCINLYQTVQFYINLYQTVPFRILYQLASSVFKIALGCFTLYNYNCGLHFAGGFVVNVSRGGFRTSDRYPVGYYFSNFRHQGAKEGEIMFKSHDRHSVSICIKLYHSVSICIISYQSVPNCTGRKGVAREGKGWQGKGWQGKGRGGEGRDDEGKKGVAREGKGGEGREGVAREGNGWRRGVAREGKG